MKSILKRIWILPVAIVIALTPMWAQVSNPSIISVSSAPSGSCSAGLPNQQVVSTGTQYSCQNGTWGAIGGGSPAGASGNPQINASGSFGADTNVFAAQSGDTISSIETECSAACTYTVNIPQTFTLTASHTLSSNVHVVFGGHGSWTVNGSGFTLTIPTQVGGTLSQHFVAGSGSVKLGSNNSLVPVEWFGAVGDWNGTTGTDNTVAIQNAVDAMTTGQVLFQALPYAINGTVNFTNGVGAAGTQIGYYTNGNPSRIVNESASANTFSVVGPSAAAPFTWNKFTDFSLERSVLPSGTATGFYASFTGGMTVRHVISGDGMIGFWLHSCPSYGIGGIFNSEVQWGYSGLTETTGTYVGFDLDSSDGNAENSLTMRDDSVSTKFLSAITSYGMLLNGTAINDVDVSNFSSGAVTQGVRIIFTGSAGNAASDIHFNNTTVDSFYQNAFYISGVTAASGASVEITGGWADSSFGSNPAFDIEGSSGIAIQHVQIGMTGGSSIGTGIVANNSSNLVLSGNIFQKTTANYIELDNTNYSSVTANQGVSPSGDGAHYGVFLTGTSAFDTVTANALGGYFSAWGIFTDTATANNTISSNAVDGTHMTLGAVGINGAGNIAYNSGGGFQSSVDTTGIASSTTYPAYRAIGPLNFSGWSNTTPSYAWSLGFTYPTGTAGNNPTFSYLQGGTTWHEAWDINPANGVLDAVNGINTPNIKSGTASNTDLAGQLTLASGTATYTFTNTYTSAPICVATDTTAASAVKASATTTVLTLTGTGTDVLNYICVGRN